MAELLMGKNVASRLDENTMDSVKGLKEIGVEPCLAIVRVGDREDDIAYEVSAKKRLAKLGIQTYSVHLDGSIEQEGFQNRILELNQNSSVHGILVFLPLPHHLDEDALRHVLEPSKDVDGITNASMANLYAGKDSLFSPCTAEACMQMLDYYQIPITGRQIVVVGRSLVIGKPVSMLLLKENGTVTLCHSKTKDLEGICRESDILIIAAGQAGLIGSDGFRSGQVVVDVGIHVDEKGGVFGDVNFDEANPVVSHITPVPGGVGPVTISVLAKHVVKAAMMSITQHRV